jgi:hypothetical protein
MNIPIQIPKIPLSWGIILALIVLLFLQRECSKCPKCPEYKITKDTIKIPGDKVPYKVKEYVPKPYYKDTGSTHWRNNPVDTMLILKDYFTKYFYNDSIYYIKTKGDTSCLVIIKEIISKNKIFNRELYVQNIKPQLIERTYISPAEKPRNKIYLGPVMTTTFKQSGIGIGGLLITKRNNGYSYSYDAINKFHTIGLFWKVGLRRNKY